MYTNHLFRLSVLACSPHGALYYWANILRDTAVTCEGAVHVGEGSAYYITTLPDGLGSMVATSTATLFLVLPPSAKSVQVCWTVEILFPFPAFQYRNGCGVEAKTFVCMGTILTTITYSSYISIMYTYVCRLV